MTRVDTATTRANVFFIGNCRLVTWIAKRGRKVKRKPAKNR